MFAELISNISINSFPAWWGAILSTLLATIKIIELWRDRFRINVACTFTSDSTKGNEIKIRNISPKPIILEHWEIHKSTGFWPFSKRVTVCEKEYDSGDISIQPSKTHNFTIKDENYFSTAFSKRKNTKFYIKLLLAGKRYRYIKIHP
ncbi:hypothetical protein [Citrobacter koseri]|uniref:hypothetical protein n=1 Tax=Citrobacter koseri TaxID=545 RepID=UPI0038927231